MSYADKTITCRDCGTDFVFTSGEQEFYAQKGFTNEPTRCPSCRQQRKAGGGGAAAAWLQQRWLRRPRELRQQQQPWWRLQQRPARDAQRNLRIVRQGGPGAVCAAWRQAGLLLGLLPAAAAVVEPLQQPLVRLGTTLN